MTQNIMEFFWGFFLLKTISVVLPQKSTFNSMCYFFLIISWNWL